MHRYVLQKAFIFRPFSRQSVRFLQNYYDVLGLKRNATKAEIKNAYIESTKKHHPDRNNSSSSEKFLKVQEAYKVLSNDSTRRQYDLEISGPMNRGPTIYPGWQNYEEENYVYSDENELKYKNPEAYFREHYRKQRESSTKAVSMNEIVVKSAKLIALMMLFVFIFGKSTNMFLKKRSLERQYLYKYGTYREQSDDELMDEVLLVNMMLSEEKDYIIDR